jgi:hypothetical protein
MTQLTIKLHLDDEATRVVDELRAELGLKERAHVLRDALAVYHALRRMMRERPGWDFVLLNKATKQAQDIRIPSLDPVAKGQA